MLVAHITNVVANDMIFNNDGTFRKWGGKNMTLGQFAWQKKKKKIIFLF
jgi:hypothetical protein